MPRPIPTLLLRVARWRDQHDIPRQCYVRVITRADGVGQARSRDKARKPLYLDFANWFLLTAFERSMAHLDSLDAVVVFEEALPNLADAPRYGEHEQRVTEYIAELSAAALSPPRSGDRLQYSEGILDHPPRQQVPTKP